MKRFIAIFITATLLLLTSATAQAMTLIRDTEIESYMAEWFAPIMRAAGMQPGTVDVYLVKDDNVNAFVAGGSNIFFHTGLLTKSENADEVIGVFAHELGHVTGGHLIRAREAQTQSATKMIVSTLVGIGAAILSGDSGAAGAAIQTGQAIGITDYLAHSRVQESAADQAALTYLAQAGKDPSGLLTFLEKLQSQELLPASQQVAYARTHPITRDRIEALRHRHDQIEAQFKTRDSAAEQKRKADQHARMRAKLIGFLSPERVERFYPESDTSLPARYARSISAYRLNETREALQKIENLIKEEPKNPYFLELSGQIHKDRGEMVEARRFYKQALTLKPDAPLLMSAYGQVMVQGQGSDTRTQLSEAVDILTRAVRLEPGSVMNYKLLAQAHAKLDQTGLARLYSAEASLRQGAIADTRRHVEAALQSLPRNSTHYVRAKDILAALANKESAGQP